MLIKIAAVSAVGFGLTVFSAAPSADDMDVAHIVVEGRESRVHEFHQNLKGILSAILVNGDLATAGVSCILRYSDELQSCDELKADGESVVKTVYLSFREHPHLTAFVLSWDKLQDRQLDADVSIKFDLKDIPPGDCTNPLTARQPCVNAPQCPATTPRRCDKVQGYPCSSCGTP